MVHIAITTVVGALIVPPLMVLVIFLMAMADFAYGRIHRKLYGDIIWDD